MPGLVTITLNVQVCLPSVGSVAVHVTVVEPTANNVPDAGWQSTVDPGQAGEIYSTERQQIPPTSEFPHPAGTSVPQLNSHVPGQESGTVTVNEHESDCCETLESVTLQFTVVTPGANSEPDAGEHTTL